MTLPFPDRRHGAAEPGTDRLPRLAPASDPSTTELPAVPGRDGRADLGRAAEPHRVDDADTGPLPIVGARPAPPPPPPAAPPPAAPPSPVAPPSPAAPPPTAPPAAPEPSAPDAGNPGGTTGASSPGRAGRDLRAAIGVGLALGAVIVASLLVYRPAFLAVLVVAVLVAVVELGHALQAGGARPPLAPVLVGALAMEVLAWTRGATGLGIAFLLTVLAVLLWRLAPGPMGYLRDAAAGVLVALYVPLLAGFAVLLLVPDDGAARVLLFIATVVCNDVGGYAAGVLVGRHPMAPTISPKKSWEGLGGSILACMAVATPVLALTFHRPWWGGLAFGAALAASATVGDLGASLVKRDLGIKDYSQMLPGHGGIMDRLDSLLPSAVVAYLLLTALAPA